VCADVAAAEHAHLCHLLLGGNAGDGIGAQGACRHAASRAWRCPGADAMRCVALAVQIRAPNIPAPIFGEFGAASRSLMAAHELVVRGGFTNVVHVVRGCMPRLCHCCTLRYCCVGCADAKRSRCAGGRLQRLGGAQAAGRGWSFERVGAALHVTPLRALSSSFYLCFTPRVCPYCASAT
jgi:hypothetical protein